MIFLNNVEFLYQIKRKKLIHKFIKAQTIIIATDHDGLLDNGHKNTQKKTLTHDNILLKLPTSCESSVD